MQRQDSEFKGSIVRLRDGQRLGFGNPPQRIIIETAAFIPGVHDSAKNTKNILLCTAAAMAAVGAGGFDLLAEQHNGSPQAHYTPEFALLPYVFAKTAVLRRSTQYATR